jgi:isopentenyl-diphosphate delta-isomerase
VDPDRVDISTRIGNFVLPVPVFIDAITGGASEAKEINRKLAAVAKRTGVAMAVGSQYGAVKEGKHGDTYAVIREENPEGIFFANVSALVTPEEAKTAVEMIDADALEIHLNAAQELIMPEGDKKFSLIKDNLSRLQDCVEVPIIIKETGCGMAAEQIHQLQALGFTCFDVAGYGGTSFAAIEVSRSKMTRYEKFADWGIPTAWSLIDGARAVKPWDTLIASGGIRSGWQAAQSIALGADAVAMSGNILTVVLQEGVEKAAEYLQDVLADLKDIMVLTGSRTIRELQQVPLIFTGDTLAFIQSRGYDAAFKRKKYLLRSFP